MKRKFLVIFCLIVMVFSCLFVLTGCKKGAEELKGNYYYYKLNSRDKDVTFNTLALNADGTFAMKFYTRKLTAEDLKKSASVIISDTQTYILGVSPEKEITGTFDGNETTVKLAMPDGIVKVKLSIAESTEADYSGKFVEKTSVLNGLLLAVIGILITFAVLAFLMGVIYLTSYLYKTITEARKKNKPVTVDELPHAEEPKRVAVGSCGDIAIYDDISDKDVALIMAIVLDTIGEPINTIRFKSIREVGKKEDK